MKDFPVIRLNKAIQEAMSHVVSIGIAVGIKDGLDPYIYMIDTEGGPVSTVAQIDEIPAILNSQYKHKVSVSVAYMQILWIICDIALNNNDVMAIENQIEEMTPEEREQFYKELKVDTRETIYLRTLLDKTEVFQRSAQKADLVETIASKKLSEEEMDRVYSLDSESNTEIRADSMYVYGMAFCLLHEFSHHSLGHDISKDGSVEEEIEADQAAFWSMYSDLDDNEKLTAMYGILCSLVSLLFINEKLIDDGIHPLPVERIFDYYELIKDENPKYAGLLCHLFYIWAVVTRDNDMPKLHLPYNEMIYIIKEHLIEIEHRNNNI